MKRTYIRAVRHWVANRGWLGLFAEVWRHGKKRAAAMFAKRETRASVAGTPPPEVHPFDARYGVDTSGLIWGPELGSGEKGEYWATAYYGVSPSFFDRAMERLGLDWSKYAFVDVGCGKGRALMLAMRYPFREVVGVELSPELARVANENIGRFRAEWRVDVAAKAVAGDATRFELPSGPLLVYLYHPFAAPVMKAFLKNLRLAAEREVYVMYVNPELDALLGKTPFLEKLWRECLPISEEDIAADRFGARQEYVSVYRSRAAAEVQ